MVNNKPNKTKQRQNVAAQKNLTTTTIIPTMTTQEHGQKQKAAIDNNSNNNSNGNKKANTCNTNNGNNTATTVATTANLKLSNNNKNNSNLKLQQRSNNNINNNISNAANNNNNNDNNNNRSKNTNQQQQQQKKQQSAKNTSSNSYAQTVGQYINSSNNNNSNNKTRGARVYTNKSNNTNNNYNNTNKLNIAEKDVKNVDTDIKCLNKKSELTEIINENIDTEQNQVAAAAGATTASKVNPGDILTAALAVPCAKCSSTTKPATTTNRQINPYASYFSMMYNSPSHSYNKHYRKSKSYVGGGGGARNSTNGTTFTSNDNHQDGGGSSSGNGNNNTGRKQYYRSYSDRRSSFDRNFAERNKGFVPIVPPAKPVLSSSNIAAVIADTDKLTIIERLTKARTSYPIMQCGTLDAPDSSYHQQRSNRMDAYQIDDGFHSDGGTETPPPSPSSGSSIASTSDHGSLESVDTGGTQRLAVLSFEQVRKLHHVMDEKVAIHGRGNFPTLEVTLKDLVNSVRRKLEADIASGGAGVIVKDIRLNGGAASHVLASEDQPYNDLDLIFAIELTSSRHFDRVKNAVLSTLLDLLPEGVSKRRIMPCALKEAYVGKMVKVNNNNDGDRWSLISLGNSPGHKNVELKFVDTMRRQFEFSVDSFQIVLDSLLLFYDCAQLPISENFYPTVVGESVYGDFQEALYHLQKKLISTRQPEEIRGGGLLKYCNLLVRNYKPVDPQHIKTLERYMCSRFFIDFPDINTQTVKLEAYLRNHFWGVEEEPMQYQYLMHLREVVEMSTVCLMGHERRQTLSLIQSLATEVFYKEQHQQQQAHAQEQYHQQQLAMAGGGGGGGGGGGCDQQQQQTVTLLATTQQPQQATQTIYVQQAHSQPQTLAGTTTAICCTVATGIAEHQQQQQQQAQQQAQQQTAAATVPQTIQIQAGPPGLIYANGVYYAPVIPTTICTCNSTWLST